jgi:hypothetical protein
MVTPKQLQCGKTHLIIFKLENVGHWYAHPTAVNLVAYFNFDPVFKLHEVRLF